MAMTIAISNQKGGVGKTVCVVNLAELASETVRRVLVVDTDPQGNTSSYFIGERAAQGEGSSRLYYDGPSPEPVKVRDGLWIIPADKDLREVGSAPGDTAEVVQRPRRHLARIASEFDLVLIDTPPSQDRRLTGALVAADRVVTPIGVDRASFEGLSDLLSDIKGVRAVLNPKLRHAGIVVNRYKPGNAHQKRSLVELREAFGSLVLGQELLDRSPVGAAFDAGRPVWKGKNGESARRAAREWRDACGEILRRSMQ